ncbi:hypothetical protein AX774_g6712 [Zancudomyces culisetae]|uniref:Uncharacterized protein n=1 Tax=Zancudomyces culisetae TaxID=1213189 RepID=A0A1R1PFT9_ZANCU|nr:hypothetical protein AX774_g6712 [Zancudomyces culisetae]|eukprot:OMH79870.1 hypothetical protein AX774_g6712 [Zancudomyces culisetae]
MSLIPYPTSHHHSRDTADDVRFLLLCKSDWSSGFTDLFFKWSHGMPTLSKCSSNLTGGTSTSKSINSPISIECLSHNGLVIITLPELSASKNFWVRLIPVDIRWVAASTELTISPPSLLICRSCVTVALPCICACIHFPHHYWYLEYSLPPLLSYLPAYYLPPPFPLSFPLPSPFPLPFPLLYHQLSRLYFLALHSVRSLVATNSDKPYEKTSDLATLSCLNPHPSFTMRSKAMWLAGGQKVKFGCETESSLTSTYDRCNHRWFIT